VRNLKAIAECSGNGRLIPTACCGLPDLWVNGRFKVAKVDCFGLIGLEPLSYDKCPFYFSFRLKFPYLRCLRSPSGTVAAIYPPVTLVDPLQSLWAWCRMDLRRLDRASATPQSNGQRSAGYVRDPYIGLGTIIRRFAVTLVCLKRMVHEKVTMDFFEIYQRFANDVHRFSLYLSGLQLRRWSRRDAPQCLRMLSASCHLIGVGLLPCSKRVVNATGRPKRQAQFFFDCESRLAQ